MKKKVNVFISIIAVITVLFIVAPVQAQILHPVKWSYGFKKLSPMEAVVMLKADIEPGWHIYSSAQADGGPVKTNFVFSPSAEYSLTGGVSEPTPVTKYEKAFAMNVSYFENSVIFRQVVHLNKASVVIKGTLKFMVCNDRQCLPPENVTFAIPVK